MSVDYNKANAGGYSGERTALPVGWYGATPKARPGKTPPTTHDGLLRIVSFIGTKPTKTEGLNRNSFLVASTNGTDGTAFLSFNTENWWTTDEAIALAFNLPFDDQATITKLRNALTAKARERAEDANTPEESMEQATKEIYEGILKQIQINVGTIFRLQDWAGVPRNPRQELNELVGTEFAGSVEPGFSGDTADVKSVFSKPRTPRATVATTSN